MSNTIILKNGTTTPDNTDLEIAEPGFKKNTGTLYIGNGDKVVQINPIISSEEPERIPGALWIDTSIESSTEDSPLPISQGGTGASNAADALVNLGAAPAGYGLGDSVWFSDGRSANDIMSNGWFSWGSGGVVDVPFPSGYMFVVARQSGKHVTQIAFNANYTGIGNTQSVVRTYGTTGWSEWEWVNPPMKAGVEYRTTERINGVPVYTQLFDCGVCINASKITTNISNVKRYAAWMSNGIALPYSDSGDWFAKISTNSGFVEVWMNGFTNQRIYVQLWYLKS